jgi:two-component system, NtrC family, sensor histidine kinase HydH
MSRLPELLYFIASVGNLCLANLVVFRARRARGALPIALLCVSLFVWVFGQGALLRWPEAEYWATIRLIGSAMAPAFLWHFVLVFTGRERTLRLWLILVYIASGIFTLSTAGALFSKALDAYVDGHVWNTIYLCVFFPFFLLSFRLVSLRRREVRTAVEQNAANFVAFGIAVAVVMGFTELVHGMWPRVIPLGHVGSVLCTLVLAVAILRHRLLEKQAPVRTLFFFLLLAASAVVVMALLSSLLQEKTRPVFVMGAVALTTLLALWRTVFIRLYEQAERRQRLALIGTMAAGVAHEIRNPLASIKGAAQFVQKDLEGTAGKDEAKEYLKLLVGEVDRLNSVVESFLTYARPMDPRRQDVSLDVFLKDLLRLYAASLPPSIKVETQFDADLPPVRIDSALFTNAVTNAIRNAAEAMPDGGTLTVRTSGVASALRSWAAVQIEDTGPGIPRDEVQRIFQPFYTTKAKGTGLGLAIAMRVLEAHGGDIVVENLEPRGCRFTFLLPLPIL